MLYELTVVMKDIEPPVWRTIEIPDSASLHRLHQVLQVAMGWLIATALLSEVCASFGDARRAENLYELLAPYGSRNAIAPQAFA